MASLRFVCGAGFLRGRVGDRRELDGRVCGHALSSGTTELAQDTELDPRVNRDATRAYEVRSSVCVPLMRGDGALGVLCVSSMRPRAFDERDLALLESLAGLSAAVVAAACDFGAPAGVGVDPHAAGCEDIERIIGERDYRIVLRPIFALSDGELFAAEALARFPNGPEGGPEACLARAREVGLGVELELALIEAALSCLPVLGRTGAFDPERSGRLVRVLERRPGARGANRRA